MICEKDDILVDGICLVTESIPKVSIVFDYDILIGIVFVVIFVITIFLLKRWKKSI